MRYLVLLALLGLTSSSGFGGLDRNGDGSLSRAEYL